MSRDRGREVTRSKAVRELMRSNLANAEALGRAMERAEQEWKRVPIQSTAALYPPIKVENQGTLIAALLPSTRWANGRTHTIKFDETSVGTYWQPTIIVSIDGVWTFMNNPFIPEEERRRRRDAIRDVPYMQQ